MACSSAALKSASASVPATLPKSLTYRVMSPSGCTTMLANMSRLTSCLSRLLSYFFSTRLNSPKGPSTLRARARWYCSGAWQNSRNSSMYWARSTSFFTSASVMPVALPYSAGVMRWFLTTSRYTPTRRSTGSYATFSSSPIWMASSSSLMRLGSLPVASSRMAASNQPASLFARARRRTQVRRRLPSMTRPSLSTMPGLSWPRRAMLFSVFLSASGLLSTMKSSMTPLYSSRPRASRSAPCAELYSLTQVAMRSFWSL